MRAYLCAHPPLGWEVGLVQRLVAMAAQSRADKLYAGNRAIEREGSGRQFPLRFNRHGSAAEVAAERSFLLSDCLSRISRRQLDGRLVQQP